jgi:hypothetical protein
MSTIKANVIVTFDKLHVYEFEGRQFIDSQEIIDIEVPVPSTIEYHEDLYPFLVDSILTVLEGDKRYISNISTCSNMVHICEEQGISPDDRNGKFNFRPNKRGEVENALMEIFGISDQVSPGAPFVDLNKKFANQYQQLSLELENSSKH